MIKSLCSTTLLAGLMLTVSAAQVAPSTYVSINGNDTTACTREAPCRTFRSALAGTDDGGTVTALDSGDFGRLDISRSVTVTTISPEVRIEVKSVGGVLTSGIFIATSSGAVVLRNLDVSSSLVGDDQSGTGIVYFRGPFVHVDNCRFRTQTRADSIVVTNLFSSGQEKVLLVTNSSFFNQGATGAAVISVTGNASIPSIPVQAVTAFIDNVNFQVGSGISPVSASLGASAYLTNVSITSGN